MHVNKHVRTCEGVCVFVCECTPQVTEGGVPGRVASQQSVHRKDGGDGAQGPDSLPAGHVRWWASRAWVSGQGINGNEEDKGQGGAAQRWPSEGLRLGSS